MKGIKKTFGIVSLAILLSLSCSSCNVLANESTSIEESIPSESSSSQENLSSEKPQVVEYDFTIEKVIALASTATKDTVIAIDEDDDDWSFCYTPIGTSTMWRFEGSENIVWEGVQELAFWVYNPSDVHDYHFNVFMESVEEPQLVRVDRETLERTRCATAGGWTKIVVGGTAAKRAYDEGRIYLGITFSHPDNGGKDSEQWNNAQLYFDGFEFIRK